MKRAKESSNNKSVDDMIRQEKRCSFKPYTIKDYYNNVVSANIRLGGLGSDIPRRA